MKLFIRYIGIILLTVIMAACGSSGGGGDGSSSGSVGTSTVSVGVGNASSSSASSGLLSGPSISGVQDIPLSVNSVLFSVTFGNGANEQRCVSVLNPDTSRKTEITETFTGANGTWNIDVKGYTAMNCSGFIDYSGGSSESIGGSTTLVVQMYKLCDLYVSEIDGNDENDCRTASDPCRSITNALFFTPGNETICVAAGFYDEESTNERLPLYLKDGTTILCQGSDHTSVIDAFDPPLNGLRATFGVDVRTTNASIIGCKIILDEANEIGIDDFDAELQSAAVLTIDDVIVKGNGLLSTTVGISIRGNSTINNSEITCSGVDLAVFNSSQDPTSITVDASNNAWDFSPPQISDIQQTCPQDGTDICEFITNVSSTINLDVSGSSPAADGCANLSCFPTGVPETICNGVDDDCDDSIDEDYVVSAADCGSGDCIFPGTLECQSGAEVCVPFDLPLTAPAPGATMVDPSFQTVCDQSFSWEGCASPLSGFPAANRYELEVVDPDNVSNPIVHATSTPSFVHSTSTPAFTPSGTLFGWTWRVRVIIDSIAGLWSPTRTFDVGDCPE